MKLYCNLKTIYQRQFGVTPIGAIRLSHTPRSQEDFQLWKKPSITEERSGRVRGGRKDELSALNRYISAY